MTDETKVEGADDHNPLAEAEGKQSKKGPLAWFARNAVAANILMVFLLIGGYLNMKTIKQEVFPEFDLDRIVIQIPYPGAAPAEVEQGVTLAVEEAVRGIDGVKKVTSTSSEGYSTSTVELLLGADPDQGLNDIKAAIDRIASFPEDAERATVFMVRNRVQVMSLVLYGDQSEKNLRALAEQVRDELLQQKQITVVELGGVRPLEISIEVSQENLRRYNLTLDGIAATIRRSSIDLPGGAIKAGKGEILVRTRERRNRGHEFAGIVLVSDSNGNKVTVGDIATITDGFAEVDQFASFDGKPAVLINVFRVGSQTPLGVSKAVKDRLGYLNNQLPPGVQIASWFDMSEFYRDRVDLLLRNAGLGLILVLIILGLFLEIKLAFWVTLGIPISFIGSLLFLPSTGMSINMISLFAFIIVLGMVVDDAIIVGEAIYKRRQDGESFMNAAIFGVKEVAIPVVFAIVTTIFAYMPMLFVPGFMGKFFRVIPIVVITVLIMSLIESLLILPAHLAHSSSRKPTGILGFISRQQQKFGRGLERFIEKFYQPVVRAAVRRRYLTFAACLAFLIASVGLVAGGRIETQQFPKVEGDVVTAQAQLPFGSSVERTKVLEKKMLEAAQQIIGANGGKKISRGIFSMVGVAPMSGMNDPAMPMGSSGSHVAEVSVYMVDSGKRDIKASEFARLWRKKLAGVAGIETLIFRFETGPSAGAPVHVELSHPRMDVIHLAAADLAKRLEDYEGVHDIEDGFREGKEQLNLKLTPQGRALGITESDLARQVRASFFGAEAVRQQRGRDEIKVYVRLPKHERKSEYNIEELTLKTPMRGGDVPLEQAATVTRGRSFTSIKRIDGRQAVAVTADVDEDVGNAAKVMASVTKDVLPELVKNYPGLRFSIGGEQQEASEANQSLATGFLLALLGMFAMLAIAFRSYVQPIIIMLAIPFGAVGALWGHLLMGYDLSMMSMMGIVALAGVVVNDSLILIVSVNRYRSDGMSAYEAVVAGGMRRFRPIILTSLTTFFGLAPMILETSVQARFLIPMAVSLGFGVMFATVITLILVPSVYLIIDDAKRGMAWLNRQYRGEEEGEGAPAKFEGTSLEM